MSYLPWTCEMCSGRGIVGGWTGGPEGGYDSQDCPDCEAHAFSYDVVMRQDADVTVVNAAGSQEEAVKLLRESYFFNTFRWSHAIFMVRSDGLRRWIHRPEHSPRKDE